MSDKTLTERLENLDWAMQQDSNNVLAALDNDPELIRDAIGAVSELLTPVLPDDVARLVETHKQHAYEMAEVGNPSGEKWHSETAEMLERLWRERCEQGRNACELFDHLKEAQQRIKTQRQQLSKQIDYAEEQQQRIDELERATQKAPEQ